MQVQVFCRNSVGEAHNQNKGSLILENVASYLKDIFLHIFNSYFAQPHCTKRHARKTNSKCNQTYISNIKIPVMVCVFRKCLGQKQHSTFYFFIENEVSRSYKRTKQPSEWKTRRVFFHLYSLYQIFFVFLRMCLFFAFDRLCDHQTVLPKYA